MSNNVLTGQVIGAAIEVHRELGPGLLESTYEICLAHELKLRRIPFSCQISIPVYFKGKKIECGYRADIVIDGKLVIELKSIERMTKVHEAQLLTYMRHGNIPVGLLINFMVPSLKHGIKRFVL